VRIVRRYQENLPDVPLDEQFCEQVFVNLIQNGYEAMGENGGELQISVTTAERGGRHGVEASVTDTGPGVSAELREQIFNPFFTTKKAGTGLGLSIVSKIVDEHHGSIELAPGTPGARFVLFFPLADKNAAPGDTPTVIPRSEATRNPSAVSRGR
jgi:signal transduction histidine kinase